MLHAEAAPFLQDRVGDDDVAGSLTGQRGRRVGLQRQGTLDVHGAPTVEVPPGDLPGKGRNLPGVVVALGHHVQVAVEQGRGRLTPAPRHPDDVAGLVHTDVLEPQRLHLLPDPGRHRGLLARETRDADEIRREGQGVLEGGFLGHGCLPAPASVWIPSMRGRASEARPRPPASRRSHLRGRISRRGR